MYALGYTYVNYVCERLDILALTSFLFLDIRMSL